MTALLAVNDIECRYGDQVVVNGLGLVVNKGTFACLLGPSGCGKTTVLRAIAGFEPVHAGEILLRGVTASRPGHTLAPEKRRIGMVFQDYALFPHMTILGNISFGLRDMSRSAQTETAHRLLDVVGMTSMGKRFPHELSGGQQQRVALARALASRPDLILMDEPFSNLDVELRERIGLDVRAILKDAGIAAVLVTHDQQEAFVLADMIAVMHNGRVIQWDTPFNLYHEPTDRFVADFIGQGIFLPGTLIAADTVETEIGKIQGDRAYQWPVGSEVDVLLRPDDVVPNESGPLQARVAARAFKGASILYTLQLPTGSRLLGLFPSHFDYAVGDAVGFKLAAQHLISFPRRTA